MEVSLAGSKCSWWGSWTFFGTPAWKKHGLNALPFSKLPTLGKERDGEAGGFPFRRNQRRSKEVEQWCCPLRKTARALELGLLRNFCKVPSKVRKLFLGSKEELQEEALGKTWQKRVGRKSDSIQDQKCGLILNPPKPKKRKGLTPWLPTSGVGQPNKGLGNAGLCSPFWHKTLAVLPAQPARELLERATDRCIWLINDGHPCLLPVLFFSPCLVCSLLPGREPQK